MATATWSAPLKHADTASFRAWGSLIHDKLAAIGTIQQTADTGQIDWATVAYSATLSTSIGYEIWFLNDSLSGTAPLYIRLDYGTGPNATRPWFRVTTGTSTNGAGTLTGVVTAIHTSCGNGALVSDTINYTSYLCVAEGFISFVGWYGVASAGLGYMGFIIQRTSNSTGVFNGEGIHITYHCGTSIVTTVVGIQTVGYTAAHAYNLVATVPPVFVPHGETATSIATVPQMYLGWGHFPAMMPLLGIGGVLISEISDFSTFSATILGGASRTYMSFGRGLGTGVDTVTPSLWGMTTLWE